MTCRWMRREEASKVWQSIGFSDISDEGNFAGEVGRQDQLLENFSEALLRQMRTRMRRTGLRTISKRPLSPLLAFQLDVKLLLFMTETSMLRREGPRNQGSVRVSILSCFS